MLVDPQLYVIKTNCSHYTDFYEKIGKFRYVTGGKLSSVIAFTSNDNINNYIDENNNCYMEYEVLHPLLKINTNENDNTDEYIIESYENDNITDNEYKIRLGYKLSEFIEENIDSDERRLSESENKLNYSEIYSNIIKFNSYFKRQLGERFNGENIPINNTERVTKRYLTKVLLNGNNINELFSYLCIQNDISMIIPNTKAEIIGEITKRYEIRDLSNVEFNHIKYAQSFTRHNEFIWNHELKGKDIIIGIGDTGIEDYHCSFCDVNYNFTYDEINLNHRKIYNYIPFMGNVDSDKGHGTHVCGIASGNCLDHPEFRSLAYESKILFFDLSPDSQSIISPVDIQNEYFDVIRSSGSYISSNSWGTRTYSYTSKSFDIDEYVYEHKDFIILFAAGNDGDTSEITISSEGHSKNIITVGCSLQASGHTVTEYYIYNLVHNIMLIVLHQEDQQ